MCNLVGAETAKHGATKVFEAVQNATYNKQLLYVRISDFLIFFFNFLQLVSFRTFTFRCMRQHSLTTTKYISVCVTGIH